VPHPVLASIALGLVVASLHGCGDDPEPAAPPATPCKPPPRAATAVTLVPAFGDVSFTQPTEIVQGPDGRFYVLEQKGIVKVVPPDGGAPTVALDLSGRIFAGGEAGLLGIAFDPRFADNGWVYLHFDQKIDDKPGIAYQSVIARFTSLDGGSTLDPTTELLVIKVDHPFTNHNGGRISFGPDGMLYWGLGDGGSSGDPHRNGQNKESLLGKILRLDTSKEPYAIPPTNPFANGGGRPEIYAWGFRNPWKHAFDPVTGDLWVGDVGQQRFEEINRVVLGGNYGWNVREGRHCFEVRECSSEGLVDPVVEYSRSDGISVVVGGVYRGTKIPDLVGKVVYGDFGTGNIWSIDGAGQQTGTLLTTSSLKISTFGQDRDGELYVADYVTGKVKQLAASSAAPAEVPGTSLASTGCVDTTAPTRAPAGAIAYAVNSPLWSDGAQKDRWLFVPPGSKIKVLPDGDLEIPPGSVAVKTFTIGGKLVETRLFVHEADGGWAGYSYEWNDAQNDAVLLTTSRTKDLGNGATWYFPSRSDCFTCHTASAGFTLGLEARQLGADVLDCLAPMLEPPIAKDAFPPLRAADTPDVSNEERARGYLHANCSSCHREGAGSGAAMFDLRIDRAFADTRTCNAVPQAGDLGVPDARIIVPGDPSRSILALRMRALDVNRMPILGTRVVDEAGVAAVEAWIRDLQGCP
jgi:uncharacterized repeat protein (TIGR03806 family)